MKRPLIEGSAQGRIIQTNLVFHGRADLDLLTVADGLVAAAYDVRDPNKVGTPMIQNTIANRPIYNDGLYFDGVTARLLTISTSIKSAFLVIERVTNLTAGIRNGLFTDINNALGMLSRYDTSYLVGGVASNYYANNTRMTTGSTEPTTDRYILHTLADFNLSSITIKLGQEGSAGFSNMRIREWGWYNRVLTENEVLINIAALNSIYSIY